MLHVPWAKKNGGCVSSPRLVQHVESGLLSCSGVSSGASSVCSSPSSVSSSAGSVASRISRISRISGSGTSGVYCCTSGINSSRVCITRSVNCLRSAIHRDVSSFGRLLGSFCRLFGGLATAAGNHQQCNWQTKPCFTDRSAHLIILLYPQYSTPRFRRRNFRLISASWFQDTPCKRNIAETGSHPIAATQNFFDEGPGDSRRQPASASV